VSGPRHCAFGRQAGTDFFSRCLTRLFINLQSSCPNKIALAFERLHDVFTIRSLQFAVRTPMQTGALGSWYLLGCSDICANMSSLWLVSAKLFGHFFKHWWASRCFLWSSGLLQWKPPLLSCKCFRIFLDFWKLSFLIFVTLYLLY
jgi:hypothetical protein